MDCNEIGQPPAQKTATISRGDDFGILFAFKSSGQVVNLTSWSFSGILRKTGQTDVAMTPTLNAAAGTVMFSLTAQQTTAMAGGANANDLSGRWQMIIRGTDSNQKSRRYLMAIVYVLN
jgi:hypothetical protein